MSEHKTLSMLQRVPVILAVTAASYGLQLPPRIGTGLSAPSQSAPAGPDARSGRPVPARPLFPA